MAVNLLKADEDDVDGPSDLWATGPQALDWEGRKLVLTVEDEERRFPILSLVPSKPVSDAQFEPSDQQQALTECLQRLLERAGQSQQAVPSLIDWMDADSISLPGGAEVGLQPEQPVKNSPLDSLGELRFIRGWSTPTLPKPQPLVNFFEEEPDDRNNPQESEWSDWLSIHSSGKININTAPRELLRALDAEMSDSLVSAIVARRLKKSLTGSEDLNELPGMNADLAFRLNRLVSYSSKRFRIRVVVDEEPGRVTLTATVTRGDEFKILAWDVR